MRAAESGDSAAWELTRRIAATNSSRTAVLSVLMLGGAFWAAAAPCTATISASVIAGKRVANMTLGRRRPLPIPDFRQILAVPIDVLPMLHQFVPQLLSQI